MKKRCFLLLTSLLGAGSLVAQAQTQTKETKEGISNEQQLAESLGTDKLVELPVNSVNRAVLTQSGNNNVANLDQHTFGGRGNAIAVLQLGNTNSVDATQTGGGNTTTVSQDGNRNRVSTDIEGYNTESTIIQDGNNNRVTQELNVDSRRYKVQQLGNNNQLDQRESGVSAPPGYEVYMKGSGMRMTIEQGKAMP